MNALRRTFALIAASAALSGCDKGRVFLDVADAPSDTLRVAQIRFDSVELLHADGTSEKFPLSPAPSYDMLQLQAGNVGTLLDNEEVTAGDFTGIKLTISAAAGNTDSFVTDSEAVDHPIVLTDASLLTITGAFTVKRQKQRHLTIDFDMRRSLLAPASGSDDYHLTPKLRLVDNDEVGEISGAVASSNVPDSTCTPAIYAFQGKDKTPVDTNTALYNSALVHSDGTNSSYRMTLMPEGDYTIAFTCNAAADDPSTTDAAVTFSGTRNVHVTAKRTSVEDF